MLSKTPEAHEVIKLYYEWSPVIVKAMERYEAFNEGMKELVDEILALIDSQME